MNASLRNAHLAAGGVIVAFAAFVGINAISAPKPTPYAPAKSLPIAAPANTSIADSKIKAMKQCAHDLKVERQRWFFEETGLTTTIDSGAAQAYANQLEAAGLEPNRPLPFRLCG